MNSEPGNWLYRGKIPSLDGWRAIAVLLVIGSHASVSPRSPLNWRLHPTEWGDIGVSIFFVISGFLISLLLIREARDRGRISLSAFYYRRILRIIPAFAFYLLCLKILEVFGLIRLSSTDWIGSLTYTVNLHVKGISWETGHFWSLSAEEHFYLIWPAVLVFAGFRTALVCMILWLVIASPLRWILFRHFHDNVNIDAFTLTRADSIGYGCLLAFLSHNIHFQSYMSRLRKVSSGVILGSIVVVFISTWLATIVENYALFVNRSICGIAIALAIYYSVNYPRDRVSRLLNIRPISFIGLLSYSLYIWQQLFTGRHAQLPEWTRTWPQNLVIITSAAMTSYFVIERPFLALKDRKKREKPPMPKDQPPSVPLEVSQTA